MGKLVVMNTDKSSKVCMASADDYIKMGSEKEINGRAISWCKIWGKGRNHKQEERIMNSKVTNSQNLAVLHPLYKDHKK